MRGLCPSRWWPGGRVPRGRDGGHLCEEGQVVQSGAATNRELLGPSQHRAKPWELSVDKVQRDVGDATCGPTLQGAEGHGQGQGTGEAPWLPLASPAHPSPQQPGMLTTLSRAPLLKEGWKVMSWAWAPGSPWMMPLERSRGRQMAAPACHAGRRVAHRPVLYLPRKQLKHGAVTCAKQENDRCAIPHPGVS